MRRYGLGDEPPAQPHSHRGSGSRRSNTPATVAPQWHPTRVTLRDDGDDRRGAGPTARRNKAVAVETCEGTYSAPDLGGPLTRKPSAR